MPTSTNTSSRRDGKVLNSVGVVGAGAWGTALALATHRAGRAVTLWAHEADTVSAINETQKNPDFLPGADLPKTMKAVADIKQLGKLDMILLVPPAQHLRAVLKELLPALKPGVPLIVCSKGIEVSTGKLMSEVVNEVAPNNPVAILSGPTFAIEVANGLPCALTLAAANTALAESLITALSTPEFRLYGATDIAGAQIGGAVKNVMAIASGIVAGLALGENARAALITRGLAEIVRFGNAFGAQSETLMGLSGLGDLLLTCSSTQSRNMSLGKALGSGQTLEDIMAGRKSVAEGVHSVGIVCQLAREKGLDMPISFALDAILKHNATPKEMLKGLLSRPLKGQELG